MLLLRQDPSLAPRPEREISRTCPYPGLLAYDAQDSEAYFGRDEEVAAALRRLRDTGVLAVVGPSGIGKSSLVRAGVVATVQRGPPKTAGSRVTRSSSVMRRAPTRVDAGQGLFSRGAGDRDRTGMASLEGWGSTIELHPRAPRTIRRSFAGSPRDGEQGTP